MAATVKGKVMNRHHTVGNTDAFQTTAAESRSTNRGNTAADTHILQSSAAHECFIGDRRDAIADANAFQAAKTLECLEAYRSNQ